MQDVIDFAFSLFVQIWQLILQYWLLSISVLITLLGWVISLIVGSRED